MLLFYLPMIHKPIGNDEEPIPSDDVVVTFGDGVDIIAAADTSICVENVVDLPADGQAVAHQILIDKGVP